MKVRMALKRFIVGILLIGAAFQLFSALYEASLPPQIVRDMESIPNYNYIPDIRKLRKEGKLSEALELARFVLKHPDMPGQIEAKTVEDEIIAEQQSYWGKTKRFSGGFITGNGGSTEALAGAISSDLVIWGDIRDLAKQGYLKVKGDEADPVIAALAGIGLLTEAVDAADWAPAVLKAFRKVGALTERFTSYLVAACKKSIKNKRLDEGLKTNFADLQKLGENLGTTRTVSTFKHVETPEDLSALSKVAQQNPDAAYLTVKNGGADGIDIIKQLDRSGAPVEILEEAAKKGPAGVKWLKKGGDGHHLVIKTKIATRAAKNAQLRRLQELLIILAKSSFWGILTAAFICLFVGIAFLVKGKRCLKAS